MRAVAIDEARDLVPVTLDEPAAGPGEVVVDVAFCGICGTDLHARHSPIAPSGTVLGHEFAGRLASVGEGVAGWSPGDRVCIYPFVPCGECPMCRAGHVHVCVNAATDGIGLGARQGAHAERVAVPAGTLRRLPESLSERDGALVEPLAVGVHGVAIASADPAEPVAVIGAGPIGAVTALALRACGFERIVVIERNDQRAARMRALGFDVIGLEAVHMTAIERFGGELPAAVFECAGAAAATPLAIELVRPKGCVVLLGVMEEPVAISQLLLMIKEAEIRASFAYAPADFDRAIALLAEGAVNADALVTAEVELERAHEMFEELAAPDTCHLKVLLRP